MLKWSWVFTLGLILAASGSAARAQEEQPEYKPGDVVPLEELKPQKAEYGQVKDPYGISQVEGDGKFDTGSWGNALNAQGYWNGKQKVIKEIDPELTIPEGEHYLSEMTKGFAVQGEWITGVGLWSKTRLMYHYLDYNIPQGAKTFTAKLFVTDDPFGYYRYHNPPGANQQFTVLVEVDGKKVYEKPFLRVSKTWGSGEKLDDMKFDLPADAKSIQFKMQTSDWGDGNNNIELVISEGKFEF